MVSLDFKTSWKMFTQRGGVCNEVNLRHFCMGLDLAFGRTDKRNREIKLNYGAFNPWQLK